MSSDEFEYNWGFFKSKEYQRQRVSVLTAQSDGTVAISRCAKPQRSMQRPKPRPTNASSSCPKPNPGPNYNRNRTPDLTPGTYWNYAEVSIYSHLQALPGDIFIRADYAFSSLETVFRLMGYTRVLSNYNSNSNHDLTLLVRFYVQVIAAEATCPGGTSGRGECPVRTRGRRLPGRRSTASISQAGWCERPRRGPDPRPRPGPVQSVMTYASVVAADTSHRDHF